MKKTVLFIAFGVMIGLVCLGIMGLIYLYLTPKISSYPPVVPQITILSAPSFAPTIVPTQTTEPEMLATLANLPPDPGATIQVGMTIHIANTGGDGLRVRRDPGVNSDPLFLAADNEEFQVISGPEQVDNLTWWYIQAPYDEKRQGWAAANYLAPNLNP